jgi:hypothetical protein
MTAPQDINGLSPNILKSLDKLPCCRLGRLTGVARARLNRIGHFDWGAAPCLGRSRVSSRSPSAWRSTRTLAPPCKGRVRLTVRHIGSHAPHRGSRLCSHLMDQIGTAASARSRRMLDRRGAVGQQHLDQRHVRRVPDDRLASPRADRDRLRLLLPERDGLGGIIGRRAAAAYVTVPPAVKAQPTSRWGFGGRPLFANPCAGWCGWKGRVRAAAAISERQSDDATETRRRIDAS